MKDALFNTAWGPVALALTVGCAGSTDTWIRVERPRPALDPDAATFLVSVGGGQSSTDAAQVSTQRTSSTAPSTRSSKPSTITPPNGV